MLRQAHKYIFVARVVAGAMLVSGCRPAAGAAADASSDAKRDGPRLVLPPDSPQIASLAITAATTESTSSISLNGRLVWNEDVTVRVFSPFAGRVDTSCGCRRTRCTRAMAGAHQRPDFGQAQADARRALADLDLAQRNLARQRDLLDARHRRAEGRRGGGSRRDACARRALAYRRRAWALYGGDTSCQSGFPSCVRHSAV